MMVERIYTLHAGSQTYSGTAKELEAIRAVLQRDAHENWAKWSDMVTPSRWNADIHPTELKSA